MKTPRLVGLVLLATCAAAQGHALVGAEPKPRLEQVIVVFKTHFDIGYTAMAVDVVQRYRTSMIDQALRVCDQNRDLPPQQQFAWTLSGWPMTKILEDWPGQTAQRKQQVLRAFKEGRFVAHALPFTLHTELLEPEDLVRGLAFSSRLARQSGQPLPRDAKMTDVPSHSWILPTLLRHAGVEFLHLGCNGGTRPPELPLLFWWEGPDGSRLLTMYTAAYGSGLAPPKDWPCKTWLALTMTGDNHGPPKPDEVKKLLDDAAKRLPGVKVRIRRMSDFSDAILAEKPDLPVVRADMPDAWIHGPMCDPAGAALARQGRPAIAAAEALATQLGAWGVKTADVSAVIASAYEQSLLYGEHTWGGALAWVVDYTPGTRRPFVYGDAWKQDRQAGRFKRIESSWAEHTAYIEKMRDLVQPALEQELGALVRAVRCDGCRVVVYNPLPWPRDGAVSVAWSGKPPSAMTPLEGSEVLPVETDGAAVRFVARKVPAMGYRVYVPASAKPLTAEALKADEAARTMASPFFRVTLDPARSAIRSVVDVRTGRELVDAAAPHGFGQYLYERFDLDQVKAFFKAFASMAVPWTINEFGKPNLPPASESPYRSAASGSATLRFQQSGSSVAAIMESPAAAGLPHAVTTKVVLYREVPVLDLEITLHDKPADPWPEAGWICLPLKIDRPQFRLGRLGSVIDPTKDIVPSSNHHLMGLNTGMTVSDAAHGVGLCPLDHPLVSLEVPGGWKCSRDFVPRQARVYVNLFNNQWTTNFRLWNQGTWTSRVRLWSADPGDVDGGLVTPSLEARTPLRAAMFTGPAGPLPAVQRGLELSRTGVLLAAFGSNPDGPGTVLRLWELAGKAGPCEVRLPPGMKVSGAQPVDLRGQPVGEPVAIKDGSLSATLRAFAPASWLLR